MCGRYFLREEEHEVQSIVQLLNRKPLMHPCKSSGIICPSDTAPVKCRSRNGDLRYYPMKWGLPLQKKLIINARSETVLSKVLFKDIFNRRCIIPASYYYEWTSDKKHSYEFESQDRSILNIAGFYHPNGSLPTFVILTREAPDRFAGIHPRMPLLLTRQDVPLWLSDDKNALDLLGSGASELTVRKTVDSVPNQLSFL